VIGTEVFNRAPGYDPAADPIVRVTAAEIRKRLAQFYQENPDRAPRAPSFRIAPGSYVPELYALASVEAEALPAKTRRETWKWLLPITLALLGTLVAVGWSLWRPRSAVEQFWGPAFHSRRAPVIVIERYGARIVATHFW
jgi:hypothetical protein